MFYPYLASFDIQRSVALIRCPACSTEIEIAKVDLGDDWIVFCPKCGAVFGVVPKVRFRNYVGPKWYVGKPIKAPAYCDFVVWERLKDETLNVFSWHGWVDPDTRAVVQVG